MGQRLEEYEFRRMFPEDADRLIASAHRNKSINGLGDFQILSGTAYSLTPTTYTVRLSLPTLASLGYKI